MFRERNKINAKLYSVDDGNVIRVPIKGARPNQMIIKVKLSRTKNAVLLVVSEGKDT